MLSLSLADILMVTKTPVVVVNAFYGGPAMGQAGAKVGKGPNGASLSFHFGRDCTHIT